MNESIPCPFCGSEDYYIAVTYNPFSYDIYSTAHCSKCKAIGPFVAESYLEDEPKPTRDYMETMAKEKWQTRPIEDELRKRIAELEKALNIDTDLTIAGLGVELRDATARIAELEEDKHSLRDSNLWLKQNYEDLERDYGVMYDKMCARIDKVTAENKVLEGAWEILRKENKRLFSQVFLNAYGKECEE